MEKQFVDYKSLHSLLKAFGTTDKPVPNKIRNLGHLSQQLKSADVTGHELKIAAQKLARDAINKLEKINSLHSALLSEHFLNPHPEKSKIEHVRKELNLTDRQFLAEQKKAITTLANILNEQEEQYLKRRLTDQKYELISQSQNQLFGLQEITTTLYQALLTNPIASVTVLSGMGGMGKSTLGNQIALTALDGMAFHSFVRIEAPLGFLTEDSLYRDILSELKSKISNLDDVRPNKRSLARVLNQFATLIYIDGIEERIDPLLEAIIPIKGKSKFLITSRQVPDVKFDLFHHPLKPLPSALAKELLGATQSSLVFRLDSFESAVSADEFERIYQKVGGNPLAVKLIAGLLAEMSTDEVMNELQHVHHTDTDVVFERVFFRVWREMHDRSKQILICLGLFQQTYVTKATLLRLNGLPNQSRPRVTPESLTEILNDLRLRSLVEIHREVGSPEIRFGIHNLTRTFLHSNVIEWPVSFFLKTKNGTFSPLSIVEEGLKEWLAHSERLEEFDRPEKEVIHDLNSISEIIYLGLCWDQTRSLAIELMQVVWSLLQKHGYFSTLEAHLKKAIDELNSSSRDPENLIRLQNRLGQIWRLNGEGQRALKYHQAVLQAAEELNQPSLIGNCTFQLGEDYLFLGEYDLALENAALSAACFEASEFDFERASALNTMGQALIQCGKLDEAYVHLTACIDLLGLETNLADTLVIMRNRGLIEVKLGLIEEAITTFKNIVQLASNYQLEKNNALNELGLIKLNHGDSQEAVSYFAQVRLDDIRQINHGFLHHSILHNLGVATFRLNQIDESAAYFERAVNGWKKSKNRLELGRTYGIFGELYLTTDRYDKAVETYDLAIELLSEFDSEKALLADVLLEKELALEKKMAATAGGCRP